MRVLLVKPPSSGDHIQPSLGLAYLATSIQRKSEVKICDCAKSRTSLKQLQQTIAAFRPDVLGLQCYTHDIRLVREVLRRAGRFKKNMVTIVGGPHPSALPEETMDFFGSDLDFVMKGEGEKGLSLLLDHLVDGSIALKDIPGLVYRKGTEIGSNACHWEEDLDSLGFPAWDLVRPETYPPAQHGAFYEQFPIAPIMLTRGCPYPCTFCAGKLVGGTRLRKRSISSVMREVRLLHEKHGIREFHIVDDNFTLDTDYAKAFLRELISQNLDMSWAVPNGVRLDTLDAELLALMKKSGLYLISVGVESGSDRILESMKKGLTVANIREKVELIRGFGIDIAGFFILGFPGEVREDIVKTIVFSLNLGLLRANYFTFLPFPGTESYDILALKGELGRVDWGRFYFMNAAYAPQGMTRRQLRNFQRCAFLRFYGRPRILLKNLAKVKSFRQILSLCRRFWHWLVIF